MVSKIAWRTILISLAITVALAVDYTSGFLLSFIMKSEIGYSLFVALVSSFFAGILFRNMGKALVCICLSIVASVPLTMILMSAPTIVSYGVMLVGMSIEFVLRSIIFILFASFLGVIAGSLVGDYFSL